MHLAIIIPTYNRAGSLTRTLDSILRAPVPDGMEVTVAAVDNRSTDETRTIIERYGEASGGIVRYVAESRNQGRSFALNTGILATESELVGFIDDDEEISGDWFQLAFRAFHDPAVDYIGGRYLPCWESAPPAWVNHPHTRTAIGWADFGGSRRPYSDPDFDALLMGGNCIFRRSCFSRVGLYSTELGRKGTRLLAGEDSDMHDRLIAAGLQGIYLPELVIHHHIPAARVKRSYMRRWAFWASASTGFKIRRHPPSGPVWCGLPRYMFTNAVRAQVRWVGSLLARHDPAQVFHHELGLWRFGGTFYGRHFLSDPSSD